MADWEKNCRQIFDDADKDKSGYIGREDLLLMLMDRQGKETDPVFKNQLKFILGVLNNADKDKDAKVSWEEFLAYAKKAAGQ